MQTKIIRYGISLIPIYILGVLLQQTFFKAAGEPVIVFRLIIGLIPVVLFLAAREAVRALKTGIMNYWERKLAIRMQPASVEEASTYGIKTPIDFAYAMLLSSFYVPYSYSSENQERLKKIRLSPKDFISGLAVFKAMFKRNPAMGASMDWMTILFFEIFMEEGKIRTDLDLASIEKHVSDPVLQHYSCSESHRFELEMLIRGFNQNVA